MSQHTAEDTRLLMGYSLVGTLLLSIWAHELLNRLVVVLHVEACWEASLQV